MRRLGRLLAAYGDSICVKRGTIHRTFVARAAAKLAESYRLHFSAFEIETVVLRYFNVFGPRQDPKSEYSAVIPGLFP